MVVTFGEFINAIPGWIRPYWTTVLLREPCVYCGHVPAKRKKNTREHIIPYSEGGRLTIDNTAPACASCNTSRGSQPFLVWMVEDRKRIDSRRHGD